MIRTALLIAAIALPADGAQKEAFYRDRFCAGMRVEVHMDNGTRADCVSGRLAIEVEFASHWSQALGQAMSYAASTGHYPAIILVCRPNKRQSQRAAEALCLKYQDRLWHAATDKRWPIPLTVWACQAADVALSDCERRDYGGVKP